MFRTISIALLIFIFPCDFTFSQKQVKKAEQKDCVTKEKFTTPSCDNPDNSKSVVFTNTCDYKADITCAIQGENQEIYYFHKENIATDDTMIAVVCSSPKGRMMYDFKRTEENEARLPTCEEYAKRFSEQYREKCRCAEKEKTSAIEVTIHVKLLFNEKNPMPLKNQKVVLQQMGRELQTTITDRFGDFNFSKINSTEVYDLVLTENLAGIKYENEKVFLAEQDGIILNEFSKNKKLQFAYTLLPTDIFTLSKMAEEDPFLKLKDFQTSGSKEIIVVQTIYYKPASWEISEEGKNILNKAASILSENPKLNVEVLSHCDSKGDDNENKKLSEKRAQQAVKYLVAKKIDSYRVKGKGMGETQILNRCKNSVECSEQEHQVNRRTEFRFWTK